VGAEGKPAGIVGHDEKNGENVRLLVAHAPGGDFSAAGLLDTWAIPRSVRAGEWLTCRLQPGAVSCPRPLERQGGWRLCLRFAPSESSHRRERMQEHLLLSRKRKKKVQQEYRVCRSLLSVFGRI
jgi:hypothetical protein